jgi:hypothetical protein
MDSSNNRVYQVTVMYKLSDTLTAHEWICKSAERVRSENEKVYFDGTFICNQTLSKMQKDAMVPTPNIQWWDLSEADCRSNLATSCGCS